MLQEGVMHGSELSQADAVPVPVGTSSQQRSDTIMISAFFLILDSQVTNREPAYAPVKTAPRRVSRIAMH